MWGVIYLFLPLKFKQATFPEEYVYNLKHWFISDVLQNKIYYNKNFCGRVLSSIYPNMHFLPNFIKEISMSVFIDLLKYLYVYERYYFSCHFDCSVSKNLSLNRQVFPLWEILNQRGRKNETCERILNSSAHLSHYFYDGE